MTQQEKQIRLAEFDGWVLKWQNKGGGELFTTKPKTHCWEVWIPPQDFYTKPENKRMFSDPDCCPSPPDYFNDLNAVHKLENILKDKQWEIYRENLRFITLGPVRMCSEFFKADVNANAFQKSQALGKTLNLW